MALGFEGVASDSSGVGGPFGPPEPLQSLAVLTAASQS